jgi:hypothetical protein
MTGEKAEVEMVLNNTWEPWEMSHQAASEWFGNFSRKNDIQTVGGLNPVWLLNATDEEIQNADFERKNLKWAHRVRPGFTFSGGASCLRTFCQAAYIDLLSYS